MDMTSRLRSHLARQSDVLYPLGKGPEAAVAAGSRIRHQRIAGLFAISLVVVAAAGFAALTLRYSPGSADFESATPPVDPAPAAVDVGPVAFSASELVESDLDWAVVDATLGDFGDGDIFEWEGTFYALSTAPGKVDPSVFDEGDYRPPQAIYTSTDGIAWSSELISDDLWISDIDHYQGTLYGVGTAPGVADTRNGKTEASVALSADGGASWERTDLPVVALPPEGMGAVTFRAVGTQIAAGPKGILTAVNSRFGLDYSPFVPTDYRGEGMYPYQTEDGIAVSNWMLWEGAQLACQDVERLQADESADAVATTAAPGYCGVRDGGLNAGVVFEATWDQLGVTEPPVESYSELFVSTDGSTFDAVASPFGQGERVDLYATEEGFLGVDVVHSQDRSTWHIWSSPDGRTWKQIGTQLNVYSVRAIGTVGGKIVLVGRVGDDLSSTPAVLLSDDGGASWKTVDLSFVLEAADPGRQSWIGAVDVDPAGLVLQVMSMLAVEGEEEPPPTVRVVMTSDFETWSEVPLTDLGVGSDEAYFRGVASVGGRVMISATRFSFSGEGESQDLVLIGS